MVDLEIGVVYGELLFRKYLQHNSGPKKYKNKQTKTFIEIEYMGRKEPNSIQLLFEEEKISYCIFDRPRHNLIYHHICDAIQGNQSEVEHVTFSVFYLIEEFIRRTIFSEKPTFILQLLNIGTTCSILNSQNNRKQKKCILFSGSISQSIIYMLPTSD